MTLRVARIELDDGLDRAKREVRLRRKRAGNMRPPLEAVADDFLELEEQVWRSEGRAVGARWKPLAPRWLAFKRRKYPAAGMLEMDGRLRDSLTKRGARWQRRDVTADGAVMATRLGIAGLHQKGGTVTLKGGRTVRIPKRPFVKIRKAERTRWAGYQQQYLSTGQVRRGHL